MAADFVCGDGVAAASKVISDTGALADAVTVESVEEDILTPSGVIDNTGLLLAAVSGGIFIGVAMDDEPVDIVMGVSALALGAAAPLAVALLAGGVAEEGAGLVDRLETGESVALVNLSRGASVGAVACDGRTGGVVDRILMVGGMTCCAAGITGGV